VANKALRFLREPPVKLYDERPVLVKLNGRSGSMAAVQVVAPSGGS